MQSRNKELSALVKNQQPPEQEITDVIVVGSGFAGLMAAIEAASLGAAVILLEKRPSCGGNSIASDGVLVATGCSLQQQAQIEDRPEYLLEDMLKAGRHTNELSLVKTLAEQTPEVCNWLIEDLGIAFREPPNQFAGHRVARSLTPKRAIGTTIIKPMLAKLKSLGAIARTGWQMTQLSLDEQGRVNGVQVVPFSNGKQKAERQSPQWIQARKAVILATGGFSADVEFRQQLNPKLGKEIGCTNVPHATAEALKEAMRIGADVIDLENIQLAPFTSPDEKGYGVAALLASYTVFPYGVLIHPETGKRFVNELADRKTHVDAMLAIASPCLGIADSQGVALSGQPIDKCLQRRVASAFDNLSDLAAHYNLLDSALQDTLERYNHFVIQGHDDDFGKPIPPVSQPLKPPYYAVRLWPKVHYTMGGLRINSQAQVIDTAGNVIKGLYAAGEVTGGVHGVSRLSTTSITECLVFGRIAGREAAKQQLEASLTSAR
ncbi:MAG: flavocytochrome c [Oscillatoria sp. PMC 1068.18]|nr:flavocytochrome c [Oscillatoria sp. PMC 1076.18]MEC4989842.1 flavocytochrome c [Oscillatoria sp. PMC 1068.18]